MPGFKDALTIFMTAQTGMGAGVVLMLAVFRGQIFAPAPFPARRENEPDTSPNSPSAQHEVVTK
jgi:hypothetical protein